MSKFADDLEVSTHIENPPCGVGLDNQSKFQSPEERQQSLSAAALATAGKHHDAALDILQKLAGGRHGITADETGKC